MTCTHEDFAVEVKVNSMEEHECKLVCAEFSIKCKQCGQYLQFVGMPKDISKTILHAPGTFDEYKIPKGLQGFAITVSPLQETEDDPSAPRH